MTARDFVTEVLPQRLCKVKNSISNFTLGFSLEETPVDSSLTYLVFAAELVFTMRKMASISLYATLAL